jgi:NADH:ubiquinone oxidoreductase subunit 6 (subunit J)
MIEVIIFLAIVVVFGIIPMIIYSKQESEVTETSKPNKIFAVITILIISINTYLAFIMSQGSIGFILGKVFFLPLLIIGLFSLSKKSRNWRSRFNILFYTGLIILISSFGSLIQTVSNVTP